VTDKDRVTVLPDENLILPLQHHLARVKQSPARRDLVEGFGEV
jgi:hypothetical protein